MSENKQELVATINLNNPSEIRVNAENVEGLRIFVRHLDDAIKAYDDNVAAEIEELLQQKRLIKQRLAKIRGLTISQESTEQGEITENNSRSITIQEPKRTRDSSPKRTPTPTKKTIKENRVAITTVVSFTQMFFAKIYRDNPQKDDYAQNFSSLALHDINVKELFDTIIKKSRALSYTEDFSNFAPYLEFILKSANIFDLREAANLVATAIKLKHFSDKIYDEMKKQYSVKKLIKMLEADMPSIEITEHFVKRY